MSSDAMLFTSTLAALISAPVMVFAAIWSAVTAPDVIFAVVTAPSAMSVEPTDPATRMLFATMS